MDCLLEKSKGLEHSGGPFGSFFPRLSLPEKDRNQEVLELSASWVVGLETFRVLPSYSKLLLGSTASWSVESLSLLEGDKDSKPGRASRWKAGSRFPAPLTGGGCAGQDCLRVAYWEEKSAQRPLGETDSLGLSGDDP